MKDVVLVTVDCLRRDHVGCYGYRRPTTPNLDALAEQGTLYEYSYANCPGTRWALQSIHAGVSTHRVDGIGLPESAGQTLAESFASAGYATFGVADNGFLSRHYNYDRGFDEYYSVEHFRTDRHPLLRVGERVRELIDSDTFSERVVEPVYRSILNVTDGLGSSDSTVTDADAVDLALSWLNEDRRRPVFLWVHLMDAHTPYTRWDDHLRVLRGDTDVEHVVDPGRQDFVQRGREPPEAVIDAYDAGIRSADEQLGRLVENVSESAIIAVTGDHGEEFGRFNEFHQASLYSSLTQVPSVIRAPELPSRQVTDHWAQHLDIPPTLVRSVGIDVPDYWAGEALQDCERTLEDPIFFDVWDDDHAVRRDDWKLVTEADEPRELYAVAHGEQESEPLEDETVEAELRALLDDHVRGLRENPLGSASERLESSSDDLDDDVRNSLEDLGYLE